MASSGAPSRLRALFAQESVVAVPGIYNPLTAKLAERAGFAALYISGGSTSVANGYPDIGLLTGSEMLENLRNIAATTSAPIIADADTGYGGGAAVTRTVREYERAGAAGLHLEDQVWPKKCGFMRGKAVVPVEAMCRRISVAVAAKSDPDFLIIARTDAAAVENLDRAIERGMAYHEAGADMVFVEALRTPAEAERVAVAFAGHAPLLFNYPTSLRPPFPLSAKDLGDMGFKLVIFAGVTVFATIRAVDGVLRQLKSDLTYAGMVDRICALGDSGRAVDVEFWLGLERRFGMPMPESVS